MTPEIKLVTQTSYCGYEHQLLSISPFLKKNCDCVTLNSELIMWYKICIRECLV